MKKYFLLIAAAATVFAVSCRKAREVEQVTPETPQEEIDDTTPQPVRFGSSLNIQVDTKAAIDKFAGTEDLYVWGFERVPGATPAADKFLVHSDGKAFIHNVKATAPATANYHPDFYTIDVFNPDGVNQNEYFYYTEGKVYDFVAYYLGAAHVDAAGDVNYTAESAAAYNAALPGALNATDALTDEQAAAYNEAIQPGEEKEAGDVLSAAEAIAYNATLDGAVDTDDVEFPAHGEVVPEVTYNQADTVVSKVVIPVTIDGTNDIMLAKTDHEFDLDHRTNKDKYVSDARMYSSYSSRRTVVPNLKFDHQLSRFIIKTKKGGTVDVNDINIKSISIQSKTVGDLYLYGTPENHLNFEPGDNAANVWLPLKTNAGVTATGHPGDGDYAQLGESIMTFAGSAVYKAKLQIEQTGVTSIEPLDFDIDISSLETGGVAVPGHQYTVNLIVYGAEKVEVTVSISEWVDMGNVDIDPDEEDDDPREANTLALSLGASPALSIAQNGESAEFTVTANNGGAISGICETAGIALVPVNHAAVLYADVDEYNTAKSTALSADEFAALTDEQKTKTAAYTGYKVTVADTVAPTGTNDPYVLTVKSAGTNTVKPGTVNIAITVTPAV